MNVDERQKHQVDGDSAPDEAIRKLRLAAKAMGRIRQDSVLSIKDGDIMPISELPRDRREAAFDIIRAGRSAAVHKALQASSEADYAKKFAQIKATLDDGYVDCELDRWLMPLAKYVRVGNSYKAYKSAICWGLRRQIREDLALQDRMQRDGFDALVWEGVVSRLQRTTSLLKGVEGTTRDSTYWGDVKRSNQKTRSKHVGADRNLTTRAD
ncbi:MAG: hypothetical protein KBC73_13140 [Burkholderiaceae bacterium]|nr:hypothetical protein [Burkholderiaceae bacterium]